MTIEHANFERELAFAIDFVGQAGQLAMKYYGTDLVVELKGDMSPVTQADTSINARFIKLAQQAFPDYAVLGEEQSSLHGQEPGKLLSMDQMEQPVWVIDPLDNTKMFAWGVGMFMVSVALTQNGRPVVAATTNPLTGETYWAAEGQGAYKNGRAIKVSDRVMAGTRIALPPGSEAPSHWNEFFEALKTGAGDTAEVSGSVFKGMRIAEGWYDAAVWPAGSFSPWDMAAVKLIVEEAGGKFTDAVGGSHGRFDTKLDGGVVISSGVVHDKLLQMIKNA